MRPCFYVLFYKNILHWNRIVSPGTYCLSEALKVNSSLTQFNLDVEFGFGTVCAVLLFLSFRNNIGDSGASLFSEVLKVNSSLTDLNLRFTPFSSHCSFSIYKTLPMSNNISDSGISSLSEALKTNSYLVKLDLNQWVYYPFNVSLFVSVFHFIDNRISYYGACSLSDLLKVNSSLTQLDLGRSSFIHNYDLFDINSCFCWQHDRWIRIESFIISTKG